MSTANISFNNYGATTEKFLSFFPGVTFDAARQCDIGSEQTVLEALGRATREVNTLLKPEVYGQLVQPTHELSVRAGEGQSGQTTFNLGFHPVIAASLHIWVRPNEFQTGNGFVYDDRYDSSQPPRLGICEVASTDYVLDAANGSVTLVHSLSLNDQVYTSYRVDVNNTAYSVPSMADIVYIIAAAEVAGKLFPEGGPDKLTERYNKKADDYRKMLLDGTYIPSEVRYLNQFNEVEREHPSIFYIRKRRT